jgi:hypothetical protein
MSKHSEDKDRRSAKDVTRRTRAERGANGDHERAGRGHHREDGYPLGNRTERPHAEDGWSHDRD